ncbi:malonyl-ACP O-methyltransferase BioC [Desmospora profundinema]|uniref:Malonyl-[acyl-carrier protein] O-methyltransferase n=1 Tax=Desmospora profundinema TaxID=1571184 RepID=A0ABU1IJ27_9BACL|nr:malonyl-ACP O-methyltransferase BioC [Desmospora profundinema]MDR6224777.1 malonyl-CoA O-methyltransferase [Desmospora profundinema]
MNPYKQKVERQFNRAASTYDRYADIQREMADRLLKQVDLLNPPPRRILEIGCGTGYLTKRVTHAYPDATIVAVDLAASMVRSAREHVSESKRVRFLVGDAETMDFHAYAPFDCILSNAAVQWFSQPGETLARLAEAVSPGGWLWFTTFGPETFVELNRLFHEVESRMGLARSRHTLPLSPSSEWRRLFDEAGLSSVRVRSFRRSVIYSDCRHFLRSIQKIGASYGTSPHPPLQSGRLLAEVIRQYDQRHRTEDGVQVTYQWLLMGGMKSGRKRIP